MGVEVDTWHLFYFQIILERVVHRETVMSRMLWPNESYGRFRGSPRHGDGDGKVTLFMKTHTDRRDRCTPDRCIEHRDVRTCCSGWSPGVTNLADQHWELPEFPVLFYWYKLDITVCVGIPCIRNQTACLNNFLKCWHTGCKSFYWNLREGIGGPIGYPEVDTSPPPNDYVCMHAQTRVLLVRRTMLLNRRSVVTSPFYAGTAWRASYDLPYIRATPDCVSGRGP